MLISCYSMNEVANGIKEIKEMNTFPLFSVIVVTYNSSEFVKETLDSILNQNYPAFELIITDDCSKDETLNICREWLDKNNQKLNEKSIRYVLTKTPKNKGITPNYNHGLKFAQGEWIKYIAGDDILSEDALQLLYRGICENYEKIFLTNRRDFCKECLLKEKKYNRKHFKGGCKRQERNVIKGKIEPWGPTLFLERDTLLNLGGFDEEYPFVEDYPIIMKYLKNGYRIGLIEEITVYHRVYSESVSKSDNRYGKSITKAIEDYTIPAALKNKMYLHFYTLSVRKAIRDKKYNKWVLYLLSGMDILHWKFKLKKKFKKFN